MSVIERKLLELFDDLDDAELKQEVRDRLRLQQEKVVQGERGHAFDEIAVTWNVGRGA